MIAGQVVELLPGVQPRGAELMTHQFAFADMTVLGIHIVGGMQTLLWLAFFASLYVF